MANLVITGGGGGLGQALTAAFASGGWKVEAPNRMELDVTDVPGIRRYFSDREVDLLVCAAGMISDMPLWRISEAGWDEMLAVNFQGAAGCAAGVLPGMSQRGGGHVVFISSRSAIHPPAGQVAYAAAKAALLGLTIDLAKQWGPSGLRVNAILPGFLETPMTASVTPERKQAVLADHTLGRFNSPAAVAGFIRHLHDFLPHTSGQVFQLDSRPG